MKKFNLTNIKNSTTRLFGKTGLAIKKASPELLVAGGLVVLGVAAVSACKATLKAKPEIDEAKALLEKVQEMEDRFEAGETEIELVNGNMYKPVNVANDRRIICTQCAVKTIKLYGPAIIMAVAGTTMILAGHNIMRKRNAALAAAYAGLDKTFKTYRSRVAERFGDEIEKEIRYGEKPKVIEETVVNPDGSTEITQKTLNVADDPNVYSDYARFFDDGCKGWSKDPEFNLKFLRMQEQICTDKLRSRGYLFLNEVYHMLGIPKTKAGQTVGWLYDEKNPIGDNFVDFGLYETHRTKTRDFVNGYEATILLDFNVDGNILNYIAVPEGAGHDYLNAQEAHWKGLV